MKQNPVLICKSTHTQLCNINVCYNTWTHSWKTFESPAVCWECATNHRGHQFKQPRFRPQRRMMHRFSPQMENKAACKHLKVGGGVWINLRTTRRGGSFRSLQPVAHHRTRCSSKWRKAVALISKKNRKPGSPYLDNRSHQISIQYITSQRCSNSNCDADTSMWTQISEEYQYQQGVTRKVATECVCVRKC